MRPRARVPAYLLKKYEGGSSVKMRLNEREKYIATVTKETSLFQLSLLSALLCLSLPLPLYL